MIILQEKCNSDNIVNNYLFVLNYNHFKKQQKQRSQMEANTMKQNSREIPEYVKQYEMAFTNLKNALVAKEISPLNTREGQESKPFIDFVVAVREVIKRKMYSEYGREYKREGENRKSAMSSLVQTIRESGEYICYTIPYDINNTRMIYEVDELLDVLQEKVIMLEIKQNYFTEKENAKHAFNSTVMTVYNTLLDMVKKINRDREKKAEPQNDYDAETSMDVGDMIDVKSDTEREVCLKLAAELLREKVIPNIVMHFMSRKSFNNALAFLNLLAGHETGELYVDIKNGGYLSALDNIVSDLEKGGIDVSHLMKVDENDFAVPVETLTSDMVSKWKNRALNQVAVYVKKAYAEQLSVFEIAYEGMDRYLNYKKRKSSR